MRSTWTNCLASCHPLFKPLYLFSNTVLLPLSTVTAVAIRLSLSSESVTFDALCMCQCHRGGVPMWCDFERDRGRSVTLLKRSSLGTSGGKIGAQLRGELKAML